MAQTLNLMIGMNIYENELELTPITENEKKIVSGGMELRLCPKKINNRSVSEEGI